MADKAGTKLRYIGPFPAVDVPALGTSVGRNHQIAVEDQALAASLLAQADWEEVGAKVARRDEPKQDETPAEAPRGG